VSRESQKRAKIIILRNMPPKVAPSTCRYHGKWARQNRCASPSARKSILDIIFVRNDEAEHHR